MVNPFATHHAMRPVANACLVTALVSALVSVPTGPSQAAGLCAEINGLLGMARSNFSTTGAGAAADGAATLPPLPGAEKCDMTRSLAGESYHCVWEFPYRTAASRALFDGFDRSFRECFGARARVSQDQAVNHPDFYDLREYALDDGIVTVSIKDKTALNGTFVFVRVRGRAPD